MSQDPAVPPDDAHRDAGPRPGTATGERPHAAPAGRGARVGALVIAVLIVASLVLYFVGDRLTPSTSQARVQAFVVPVAAEVAGKVLAVHIRNNDEVQPGQPLFDIDPQPYRIALARSRADSSRCAVRSRARWPAVEAARASLAVAEASRDMAERDASRLEKLYDEDPGAISVRRLEIAQATRDEARSKVQPRPGRPAQGAGGRRRSRRRQRAAAQRRGGGREGRTRPGAHARASRRRAAWSPTCAPTSATSRSPARR